MVIVGEKINSSLKGVTEAVRNKDVAFVQQRAIEQKKNGADYIDVNCGTLIDYEVELLPWLVETVQEVVDLPCCIDSPNSLAIAEALKVHKGKVLINSITAEKERYEAMIPLVLRYKAGIIGLTINDEHGMPNDSDTRVKIGIELIEKLVGDGVPMDDIYIDPLIQPISVNGNLAVAALETIQEIKKTYPKVHFMCGLSNVSFGLPKRGLLNQCFLTMCMMVGLDGAILDPGNKQMMGMIAASEALLNKDKFTKKYLKAYRKGLLDF